MKPYFSHNGIEIYLGDCRDVVTGIPEVDTVITDPPYGMSFMGKEWDHGVPGVEFFELFKLASKPGAMMLAFGGTRTFHRLACAIEDAGWEIRDCLMWLYGSGFPKSLDISKAIDKANGYTRKTEYVPDGKNRVWGTGMGGGEWNSSCEPAKTDLGKQWDGWGTALKPAWEPIILAMKPLDGTFAENAKKHGVAGLNIDGGRIETAPRTTHKDGSYFTGNFGYEGGWKKKKLKVPSGRFPSNLLLDEESAAMLDEQSGESKSSGGNGEASQFPDRDGRTVGSYLMGTSAHLGGLGDYGGASRFFYVAKASNDDRGNREELEMPLFNTTDPGLKNIHPTVKPLELMEKLLYLTTYLCKLTSTPTGGTVLDPFAGSGSTLVAAKRVGRKAIGIEKEEKYAEIAAKRLSQEVFDFKETA